MVKNATAASNRTKTKPTEVLGGQLEFDETCINKKVLDLFAPAAVSVKGSWEPAKDRYPDFTLVMGPSGSGKTMFCLKELPKQVFCNATLEKEIFRVHLTADTLLGSGDNTKAEVDLSALLVNHVHQIVEKRLTEYVTKIVPPIDLALFIVIDEAGQLEHKPYFDKAAKIRKLVQALYKMEDYKFTKGVHVTITGTSLETSTIGIHSRNDTVKFRMLPWTRNNFHALLANLKRFDEAAIRGMVEHFPVLESLTTNARCAYFFASSMPDLSSATKEQWADDVQASVANVARCYAGSNGLRNMIDLKDKFIVAQEAFKTLNQAMVDPSIAVFPSFDHIQKASLRSVTQSLLSVNVEIKSDKVELMEPGMASVSMTPAITVVLAELLCQKARISWDWQGCESTAALGEWKRVITELKASDFTSACGITYLRAPVPAGRAKVRFTVPVVGKSSVVLNGPTAPYADVMAPFRLVQAKFSVNINDDQILDFAVEMGKMGLLNSTHSDHRLQQAITSVLYNYWQTLPLSGSDDQVDRFARWDCYKEENRFTEEPLLRSEHYPFETLLSGYSSLHKRASFIISVNSPYVFPDDNDIEATQLIDQHPIRILEEFSEKMPVTALFVTNVKSFVLKHKGKALFTISRSDVDWQGILKETLPEYLAGDLRKHVDVRFMFYGG